MIGSSGGGYSDAFDGLEDSADDAKDAVDDTSDSVKKLSKQLMGFDELNVINTNSDNTKRMMIRIVSLSILPVNCLML